MKDAVAGREVARLGTSFIPRVGHEVTVDYMNGDPDQPLIRESVTNANNLPPWPLATNHVLSGTVFAIVLHDGFHGLVMELAKIATLVAGLIVLGSGSGWIYRRFASSLINQST